MVPPPLQASNFAYLSQNKTVRTVRLNSLPEEHRFCTLFGVSPHLCSVLKVRLSDQDLSHGKQFTFCGALCSPTEDLLALIAGFTRKLYRKLVRNFINEVRNILFK